MSSRLLKPVAIDSSGKATPLGHLDTLKNFRIVIRAAQRHSAWIEKQCGVSGAQLWVMQELHEHSGLRVGEIANRLAIHQTTASNLLDSLERRGYVVKTRDREDQRVVKLRWQRAGRALDDGFKPDRVIAPGQLLLLAELPAQAQLLVQALA